MLNFGRDFLRNFKKLGIVTLSTGLSFGILAPAVGATAPTNGQQEKVQIRVAQTETVVTKSELIEKFKGLFPKRFDFLNESDFHMSSGHHYPGDDTIRYNLSFHKEVNGKQLYGDVGFIGKDLEIENFHYQPANAPDALFPAKVTEEEAEKIALSFLSEFPNGSEYQLDTDHNYYPGNQTLTEPIRYSFAFVRTKNQVPISDQQIQITVLGNGEVVEFYRSPMENGSQTYDDMKKVKAEEEILNKVKANLSTDLQYRIDVDYQTGEKHVKLVYQPTSEVIGVNALSGDWQTVNGFSSEFPEEKEIKMITAEPMQPNQSAVSLEEARDFAKELLAVDSEEITLSIESIDERENYNGQEVISIQYMYQYDNGGHGAEIQLNKNTGEIIQYHDIKSEVLDQVGEELESDKTISSDEALQQAVKYLKEFTPSYLHNYAMPVRETSYEEEQGIYHFSFPRVVNGILVSGDQISASVSADGSLLGLNVDYQDIDNWPSSKEVISEEEATAKFIEQLSLDLRYVKETYNPEEKHYHLVYSPLYNENDFSFLDANTGEWSSMVEDEGDRPVVSHPWAEEELNYLIHAGILDIRDENSFDADAPVTKGDAIEIIMKSLTPFFEDYYPGQESMSQTFENIDPKHPLYQVVERAVNMGILTTENTTFELDAPLTREELAVWYVRALELEQAAKNNGIYQLDFADANKVNEKYIGHVALTNSLGLLTASNDHFNPKQEITYAELAVSDFLLAHEVYERGLQMYY
jgi:hypothetical protein